MMNLDQMLTQAISGRIGELTVANAKLSILVEALKMELAKRDEEIAKLKGVEPEQPIEMPITEANGHAAKH